MSLPVAITLLALGGAITVAGLAAAVLELALGNYRLSILSSLTCLAATPLVLIGHHATQLATRLATH